MKKTILIVIILAFFTFSASASTDLSVGVQPQSPEVGETVTVTVDAYSSGFVVQEITADWGEGERTQTCGFYDCEKTWSFTPSKSGEVAIEIKAFNADPTASATTSVKRITVEESDSPEDREPSISLQRPDNNANGVSTVPSFKFIVSDPDSRDLDSVKIAVEEKQGNDNPWSYFGKGEPPTEKDVTSEGRNIGLGGNDYNKRFSVSVPEANLDRGTEYVWGVKANDGENTVTSETFSFTTKQPDKERNPVADFDWYPTNPEEGELVTFTSDSYDRDGRIKSTMWDLDNDGDYERSGETVTKRFYSSGEKTVKLRVTDNDNNRDVKTRTVDVQDSSSRNRRPNADLTVTPSTAERGTSFTFDASASTDDRGIERYRFDFNGDGVIDLNSNTPIVQSTRYGLGRFNPTVKVVDAGGRSDVAESSYRVTRDPIRTRDRPEIELKNPEDGAEVEPEVNFRWLITDDDDSSMRDTKLVVEEKNYNGDVPWNKGREYDVSDMTDSTQAKTVELDENTVYVWGIKANDGNGYRNSEVFEFVTSGEDDNGEDDNGGDGEGSGEDASLDVDVEDEDGNNLDAYVDVDGPEDDSGRTGTDGDIDFDLEPGEYDVTVSKSGYETEERTIDLDAGEEANIDFTLEREREDLEVIYTRIPETVCRGENLEAEIAVRNNGGSEHVELRFVAGSSIEGREVEIDSYSTEVYTLTAENVQGDELNAVLTFENGEERRFRQEVEVRDCGTANDLTVNVRPDTVSFGERFEVSGYLDGVNTREKVEIYVEGTKQAETTTDRRGRYSTFVLPTYAGRQGVRVEADGDIGTSSVNVKPTIEVSNLNAPGRAFQSRSFNVCARVSSQMTPQVQLLRDGRVIDSKTDQGNVCFETTAYEPGEYSYGIKASTYGVQESLEREVEVLETGTEATSFPGKVATVRADDGLVHVEVYNNRDDAGLYEVRFEGMPESWVSKTDRAFELAKGEKKTVYFYFVPEREGRFYPEVSVDRNGERIYSKTVPVKADGTTENQVTWQERLGLFSPW